MNSTIYKVVFLNDMYFVQERNFETSEAAAVFAATLTSWNVTLKIEVTGTVTEWPEPEPEPDPEEP